MYAWSANQDMQTDCYHLAGLCTVLHSVSFLNGCETVQQQENAVLDTLTSLFSEPSVCLQGAVPMGTAAWEAARIQDGRPVAGKELTEQHLPLDAGLYHAVSLNKGCYMGQETLAKVHKLNAVKQQLHGLMLDAQVPIGTPLLSGEDQVLFRVMGRGQGGWGSGV